jgi:hypothetical protein
VCSNNSLFNLAILEEEERWHGLDTQFLSNIWELVDVERIECGSLVFFGPPNYDMSAIEDSIDVARSDYLAK